jgi:hypothetical protein
VGGYYPGITTIERPQVTDLTSRIRHQEFDPPSQSYPGGPPTIIDTVSLGPGFESFLPLRWTIPARPALVQTTPGIRFIWNNGPPTLRQNTSLLDLEEPIGSFYLLHNGLYIVRIEFVATNPGAPEVADFGLFIFEGWQL